jgi:hypothetical protein
MIAALFIFRIGDQAKYELFLTRADRVPGAYILLLNITRVFNGYYTYFFVFT